MRYAKSAKARIALGATLVAIAIPASAGIDGGAISGIDGGAISGIDGGAISGIDGGAISGIDGGAISGIDGGAISGIDGGAISGIDGGAIAGIDGGAISGIDGGAISGIDGGAISGIDGGAISGIDGGAISGIDGGAISGIDGGAISGIDGGAISGIDGGAISGIDGGAISGIDGGAISGIDGGAISGIDGGAILSGPVDSIDMVNGVFESMGQFVMASQSMLSSLRVGDYVSVQGSVVSAGWLYADAVEIGTEAYVPGASEVFVTGMLTSVDAAMGKAQMGGLMIDYTPSLGAGGLPSQQMWSFSGIRPTTDGAMISNRSGAAYELH